MAYDNNEKRMESVYSKRIRAGKRRTYFFDVRATRSNDYYLTITESRKKFNEDGYDRHKLFLYKEDFNKFLKALTEAVDYVKTDLMPDFDFDAFNHENPDNYEGNPSEVRKAESTERPLDQETNEGPGDTEVQPVTNSESPEEKPQDEPPANPTQHEEVDKW